MCGQFSDGDLYSALMAHEKDALVKIDRLPDSAVLDRNQEELLQELLAEYGVQEITLNLDQVKKSIKEVDVDVRHDPFRHISDRSKPAYVKGFEFTCEYPYLGDSLLWKLRPSTFSSVSPSGTSFGDRGGRNGTLVLKATIADKADPEKLLAEIDRELKAVHQYIGWQVDQIEQFNHGLESKIRNAISKRIQRVQSTADLAAALGATSIPRAIVKREMPSQESRSSTQKVKVDHQIGKVTAQKHEPSSKQKKQYDLFISHASEDKEVFVRPLAEALRSRGIKVWIDETELTLGDSLRRSIDHGLLGSRYGLVVLSQSFFSKSWPQYELDGLVAREINGQKVILPIWLGVTYKDVLGFSPSLADKLAANASHKSVEEIANEIIAALHVG